MNPQEVPVTIRLTLQPEDQEHLHDLTERLGLGESQILRIALASYRRQLDLTAQLSAVPMARELADDALRELDRIGEPAVRGQPTGLDRRSRDADD